MLGFPLRALLIYLHVRPRDTGPFEFSANCDPTRQKVILQAYADAKVLASAGANLPKDSLLYPAMDFFGPLYIQKYGEDSIASVLRHIKDDSWKIKAACETSFLNALDQECVSPYLYGGINSSSSVLDQKTGKVEIKMHFCRDFFRQQPLLQRINTVISSKDQWWAKHDIGAYHSNQGTNLLRELVPYGSNSSVIGPRIGNLWIKVNAKDFGMKFGGLGCYGPVCAKILAALRHNDTSGLNADNYALYALEAYMMTMSNLQTKKTFEEKYRWLPQVLDLGIGPTDTGDIMQYEGEQSESGAVKGVVSLSKFYRDPRYESFLRNWTDPNSHPHDGVHDLTGQVFLNGSANRNDYGYPVGYWSTKNESIQAIHRNRGVGKVDFGSVVNTDCVSKNNSRAVRTLTKSEDLRIFSRSEALPLIQTFCERVGAGLNISLVPYASLGNKSFPHSKHTKAVGHYRVGSLSNNRILYTGFRLKNDAVNVMFDPSAMGQLFEGISGTEIASNCIQLYHSMLIECDTHTDTEKMGAFRDISGVTFEIVAMAQSAFNGLRQTLAAMPRNFTCQSTSESKDSLWLSINHYFDPKYTCTCRYEDWEAFDVFCKPQNKDCKELASPQYNAREWRSAGRTCGPNFVDS